MPSINTFPCVTDAHSMNYIFVLTGFGFVVLLTAWLPLALKNWPLSLPIFCVALGAILFDLPFVPGAPPNPVDNLELTERLTELIVLISLMGAGLKIDRLFSVRSWMITWRLLLIAMPITIVLLTLLGQELLFLSLPTALLLASLLAPTDPVLASDVQVGAPREGQEDEVRFALTSEAGLNDGLAFPFVQLALIIFAAQQTGEPWVMDWFLGQVVWKITAGVLIGCLAGWILSRIMFYLPNNTQLSRTGDGFVALGATCLTYGLVEICHGYGFLGVFVAAVTLRYYERNHDYHATLHHFAEGLERLLMMVLLVVFGGALVEGSILKGLDTSHIVFACLAVFVIRPLAGMASFIGSRQSYSERAIISFFGIRGLGSVYYLSYALNRASFEGAQTLWSVTSFIILLSIILHGTTVTPVMNWFDRRSGHVKDEI